MYIDSQIILEVFIKIVLYIVYVSGDLTAGLLFHR